MKALDLKCAILLRNQRHRILLFAVHLYQIDLFLVKYGSDQNWLWKEWYFSISSNNKRGNGLWNGVFPLAQNYRWENGLWNGFSIPSQNNKRGNQFLGLRFYSIIFYSYPAEYGSTTCSSNHSSNQSTYLEYISRIDSDTKP